MLSFCYFKPLDSKKLDENNKDLLELKAMSVNALKELQKKNKKEVKEELLTKPEKGKVKLIQNYCK